MPAFSPSRTTAIFKGRLSLLGNSVNNLLAHLTTIIVVVKVKYNDSVWRIDWRLNEILIPTIEYISFKIISVMDREPHVNYLIMKEAAATFFFVKRFYDTWRRLYHMSQKKLQSDFPHK